MTNNNDMREATHSASYNYTGPQVDAEPVVDERTLHIAIVEIDGVKQEFILEKTDVGKDPKILPLLNTLSSHGAWYEQRLDRKETPRKQTSEAFRKALDAFEKEMWRDINELYPALDTEQSGKVHVWYTSTTIETPVALGRKEHERRRALFQRLLKEHGVEWTVSCSTKYPSNVCARVDDSAADLTPEQVNEGVIELGVSQ